MNNKKKIIIYSVGIILVIGAAASAYGLMKNSAPGYNFIAAKKGDLTEEVEVAGAVKPAQAVHLAFERSGKIALAKAAVGDRVTAGQVLATLSNLDLVAQLDQAQAAYSMQAANLANLKNGAKPEDIQLSQTQSDNARANLAVVEAKTANDLGSLYAKTSDILNGAYANTFDAVYNKTNGIYSNALSIHPDFNLTFSDQYIETALRASIIDTNGELAQMKNEIDAMGTDQTNIDNTIASSLNHMGRARDFLKTLNDDLNFAISTYAVPNTTILGYKTNVSLGLASVNAAIASVNGQAQAIAALKIANQNQLVAAQAQVDQTARALALKKSSATRDQILAQEAAVEQALAGVENAKSQLSKTVITSPIDGFVSQQDAKTGEIATMNVPVISVISDAKFQIDTMIAESDIAKIKIGQIAFVTLDADNNQKILKAKVITIDPGQTIDKGSPTYKVTLEFADDDPIIKDGLSANAKIVVSENKNVLLIPSSSIIKQKDKNIVLVDDGKGGTFQKTISVGASQGGQSEITDGLAEGDRVATFGSNK